MLHKTFWFAASLTIAIVLNGSFALGSNKVAECNRISTIVNQAATEAQSSSSNTKDPVGELEKVSRHMTRYAAQLDKLQIQDSQLRNLKARFAKMYRETATASTAMVTAARARDEPKMSESLTALQRATSQEDSLVSEFNKYCGAN